MLFKAHNKVHYDSGPNMTPLVDVVMVILIFLMLTGSFGAASHFLPTNLPKTDIGIGGPSVLGDPRAAEIEIFISSLNDGTFRARLAGGETFTDTGALLAALDARRIANENTGLPAGRCNVVLHPRLSTRHSHVTATYQAAMDAGWPRISFASARD